MKKQNTKWKSYVILNADGDIWTAEIFKTRQQAIAYMISSGFERILTTHTVAPAEVKIKLLK